MENILEMYNCCNHLLSVHDCKLQKITLIARIETLEVSTRRNGGIRPIEISSAAELMQCSRPQKFQYKNCLLSVLCRTAQSLSA
jgi:hypothetical protein